MRDQELHAPEIYATQTAPAVSEAIESSVLSELN